MFGNMQEAEAVAGIDLFTGAVMPHLTALAT
jgi:hypothetical protein